MDATVPSDGYVTAWQDNSEPIVLQVGSRNVQVNNLGYKPPIVRSAYLEQVRRIAPPELKDRDAELADLTAFCTGDSDYAYALWRAPAWAGKSALMSWFVLHPPPGVRIVSFFVTARHHRQNDRKAFIDNVLEQLAELLEHRGLPAGLTESTQEAHLAEMLARAAEVCRGAGQRLVLLLDGLDEDRGVTVEADSYSIAATLPHRPPAGLRVIVSSRLDPPIPLDVPPDHPLRGRCRVWDLSSSAYAEVARADVERELKRITLTGGVEQDILGFVTAARSGLTVRDLAELVDEDEWLIEGHLTSFTGRTFTRVDAAYVLAHEELQATATKLVGLSRLRDYRRRLHEWAERYRDLGWPVETPDYILRGYFRLMSEQGENSRLVQYAADAARHDRMLDHTGGDAVALEEITLAQDALLASSNPDLQAMCKLTLHRMDLEQRNMNIPLALPRLWAAVGNVVRAEALVHSIPEDGSRRAVALWLLAPRVASAGHHARAELLASLIPASTLVASDLRDKALCNILIETARNGDFSRAFESVPSINSPFWRSRAYCEIAIAHVNTNGDLAQAEERALQVPTAYWRAQTLAVLAKKAAVRQMTNLAERLSGRAETEADFLIDRDRALIHAFLAREIEPWSGANRARQMALVAVEEAAALSDPRRCAETLTEILPFLTRFLDRAELADIARQAESALITFRDSSPNTFNRHGLELIGLTASAWYTAGDLDRAIAIASSLADPEGLGSALLELVGAVAAAGDLERALALAKSIPDQAGRDRAFDRIMTNLSSESNEEHLADIVNAIQDRAKQANALTNWGYRAAKRGDIETAINLARRAEAVGRSIGDPAAKARLLTPLVSALVGAGDTERAQIATRRAITALRAVPQQHRLDSKLIALVRAAANAGDYEAAADAAQLINKPHARAEEQARLASLIGVRQCKHNMAIGLLDDAEKTAMSIPEQRTRLATLRKILSALWVIGDDKKAEFLVNRIAERDSVREPLQLTGVQSFPTLPSTENGISTPTIEERDKALSKAVEAVATMGDFTRAEALSGLIAEQRRRVAARTSVVLALARAGQHSRAYAQAQSEKEPRHRDRHLRELAEFLTGQGALELAEEVTRSIHDDFHRTKALIGVARKVKPTRAQSLLLDPVRHGRLPEILSLISEVCPQALNAIADHLLADRAEQSHEN